MANWWNGLSLKSKLQIPIQIVLLVLLLSAQKLLFDQFARTTLDDARERAIMSSDGVINGLNIMMMTGTISDKDNRKLLISDMKASRHVTELRLVRGPMTSAQFGPGLPEEQPKDSLDHQALDSGRIQTALQTLGENKSLRVVVPFTAQSNFRGINCLLCHTVKEGTVNGAASITIELNDEFALLNRVNLILWAGQFCLQILLYLILGWSINRITKPSRELQQTMQTMVTERDLNRRARVQSRDEIGATAQAFNNFVETFQGLIRQLQTYADRVSGSAHALTLNASKVEESSTQQSTDATSSSSSMESMTQNISSVAESAQKVSTLSQESLRRAQLGQSSVQEMTQEIEKVESSVQEMATSVAEFVRSAQSITSMTQQVRDIAEQTNLLALNAAIEAARAGEQGRGFAVVADEVRKLAEKSAVSASQIDVVTQELSGKSEHVDRSVQSGMNSLHSTRAHLRDVQQVLSESTQSVSAVCQGVNEINDSVNQQQSFVLHVAQNLEQVAARARNNNETIRSMVQAVGEVESMAARLRESGNQFKV